MSVDVQENEDFEDVEVDVAETEVDEVDFGDDDETRTNVQDASGDDELSSYSNDVKKRINRLTARRKQAAEEAEAAYNYARQMEAENQKLRAQFSNLSTGYHTEQEGRVASQEAQVKKIMTEAYEAGDYNKVADAQQALAELAIAKQRIQAYKAQQARQQQAAQQQAQVQQQVQVQPQRQAPPRQDPKLDSWLEKNPWFGSDRVMTRAAQAIHETLVLEEDFDPTSDDYYKEIDRRMRREMPEKFKGEQRRTQAVAPSSGNGRSLKSGRKKQVELTPGQLAFCKKMRIPPERYAKEMLKIESRRD